MGWSKTDFENVWVYEPRVFGDERGYFFESFHKKNCPEDIKTIDFIQDNEAKSTKGVLRGLHYQLPPFTQSKLVRVVVGEILDVIVDVRSGSPTYGKNYSIILSESNKKQLFVPKGFAHGYVVLSEMAIFSYKCDNYYHPEAEAGLRYNDPSLHLNWILDESELTLSARDKDWPDFNFHKKYTHD
jgi:dTDP-4-dehydrorhamnose 3,5-epimerase